MTRQSLFFISLGIVVFSLLLNAIAATSQNEQVASSPKPHSRKPATFRAVFGSCSKHDLDHSFWKPLIKRALLPSHHRNHHHHNPNHDDHEQEQFTQVQDKIDAQILLGDIVYQDSMPLPIWPYFVRVNETEMKRRWNHFKQRPEYQDALKQTKKVIGIYDDHDFSSNDEGREATTKELSQQLLLDFLDVPQVNDVMDPSAKKNDREKKNKELHEQNIQDREAQVRRIERKGVYAFHKFPLNNVPEQLLVDEKVKSQLNICVILLDGRTHRDRPRGDGKGDVLGEAQWKWFERVLRIGEDPEISDQSKTSSSAKSTIDDACVVTFIGSGVQVLADTQPMENWGEFPEARDRLLRLLQKSGSERFIFLSGDVHFGEINVLRAEKIPLTLDQEGNGVHQRYHECGESPFEAQNLYDATSSGFTHHVHPLFEDAQRFQKWFPSHRRTANGPYMRENAGIIQVDCPVPSDPRSCNIGVSIVALPNASVEVARININFALEKAAILDRAMRRPASEIQKCRDLLLKNDGAYTLPTYFALWTQLIMWMKKSIPFMMEEGRLTFIFIHAWIVLISLLILLKVIVCRCCFGRGKKEKRDQDDCEKLKKKKKE